MSLDSSLFLLPREMAWKVEESVEPRRVFLKMGEIRAHPGLMGESGSTGATVGAKPLGERAGDPVSRGGLALGTAVHPLSRRGSGRVGVDMRTSRRAHGSGRCSGTS